jgi:hypothetical protein
MEEPKKNKDSKKLKTAKREKKNSLNYLKMLKMIGISEGQSVSHQEKQQADQPEIENPKRKKNPQRSERRQEDLYEEGEFNIGKLNLNLKSQITP